MQFGHLDKTVRAFFLWFHFETTSFRLIYYCAFRYILGHTASIIPKKKEVSKIWYSRSPFIYPVKCTGRGHKVLLRYVPCTVLLIVIKRYSHSVIYFFQGWFFSMWKSDDSEIGPFPFRNWFYQGSNFPHDCFSITTQNNICTPIQFRQKLLRWAFAIRNLKSFSEAKRKSLALSSSCKPNITNFHMEILS